MFGKKHTPWWRPKDTSGDQKTSWYEEQTEEVDEVKAKEESFVVAENRRIYEDEMTKPFYPSRYNSSPTYEIPAAMLALKGTPTDNVGLYLKWKNKNNG